MRKPYSVLIALSLLSLCSFAIAQQKKVVQPTLGIAPVVVESDLPEFTYELTKRERGRNSLLQYLGDAIKYAQVSKDLQSRYLLWVKWQKTEGWNVDGQIIAQIDLRVMLYDTQEQQQLWRMTVSGYATGEQVDKKLLQQAWRDGVGEIADKVATELRHDRVRTINEHGLMQTYLGTHHGLAPQDSLQVRTADGSLVCHYRIATAEKNSCWAYYDPSKLGASKAEEGMFVSPVEGIAKNQQRQQQRTKIQKLLQSSQKAPASFDSLDRFSALWQSPQSSILQATINKTRFRVGEPVTISFHAKHKGYVYLFNITDGQSKMVLPLVGFRDNHVTAGKNYGYPYSDAKFPFYPEDFITEHKGSELFLALWSEQRIAPLQKALDKAYDLARQKSHDGEDYDVLVPVSKLDLQTVRDALRGSWDSVCWRIEVE